MEGKEMYDPSFQFVEVKQMFSDNFSKEVVRAGAHLLWQNEHVKALTNSDWNSTQLKANVNGMYAFEDGYYLDENRKDIIAVVEGFSKWIIPILSLALSIIALVISVNKKS